MLILLSVCLLHVSVCVSAGGKVVEGVLPVLLKNGLTNPSDEIKAISLRSILKISKNAVSDL